MIRAIFCTLAVAFFAGSAYWLWWSQDNQNSPIWNIDGTINLFMLYGVFFVILTFSLLSIMVAAFVRPRFILVGEVVGKNWIHAVYAPTYNGPKEMKYSLIIKNRRGRTDLVPVDLTRRQYDDIEFGDHVDFRKQRNSSNLRISTEILHQSI